MTDYYTVETRTMRRPNKRLWSPLTSTHTLSSQIRILENEAKNGSSITKKRRMMEQVRQCRTKWSALKASFEKELLAETTRARESSQSSMDGTSTTEQLESCAARIDRFVVSGASFEGTAL
uniref:Uncharacterized protein n=1 Tax=Hyaloperonospora arabidopsidis (strain Emoy2) TaxID=559515 RepID=M4BBI7_HYAAE